MYFENSKKRVVVASAFMLEKDLNSDELIHEDVSDTLIDIVEIMIESVNLQRAQLVILIEFTYDVRKFRQILKRTHRQKNKKKVYFYVISFNIEIEKTIDEKRLIKIDFFEKSFQTINVNVFARIDVDELQENATNRSLIVNDEDNESDDAIWEEDIIEWIHIWSSIDVFMSSNNRDLHHTCLKLSLMTKLAFKTLHLVKIWFRFRSNLSQILTNVDRAKFFLSVSTRCYHAVFLNTNLFIHSKTSHTTRSYVYLLLRFHVRGMAGRQADRQAGVSASSAWLGLVPDKWYKHHLSAYMYIASIINQYHTNCLSCVPYSWQMIAPTE